MTVGEVCAAIERWAPAALAYPWDRSGLQIGRPDQEVRGIVTALSVTREVLDAAADAGANMIVSHHPVIWTPLTALCTGDPHTRLILELAQRDIACYAAHTNLDVAPEGVSASLAQLLGLQECGPLLPAAQAAQVKLIIFVPEPHLAQLRDAVAEAGAGIIGEYTHCSFSTPGVGTFRPTDKADPYSGRAGELSEEPERRFEVLLPRARLEQVLSAARNAHPYEEMAYDVVPLDNHDASIGLGTRGRLPEPAPLEVFAREVARILELNDVRVSGAAGHMVQTVGVLGGSGGGELTRMPPDIDVAVTGDVKYHDAWTALEHNLAVVDAGHWGTEKHVTAMLAAYLERACPSVKVSACVEPNPFRTVTG